MDTSARLSEQMMKAAQDCADIARIYRNQKSPEIFGQSVAVRIRTLAEAVEDAAADETINKHVDFVRRRCTNNHTYARRQASMAALRSDPDQWSEEIALLAPFIPESVIAELRSESDAYFAIDRPPLGDRRPKRGKTRKVFRGPKKFVSGAVIQQRHRLTSRRPLAELVGTLQTDLILDFEGASTGQLSGAHARAREALLDADLRRLYAAIVLIVDILGPHASTVEASYTLAVGIARY